jgi:hypothetical protein
MTDPGEGPEREQVIAEHERGRGPIAEYGGGEIRTYRGLVNGWLLVVYAVLGVWAVYYLFRYWGGLGPGLAR